MKRLKSEVIEVIILFVQIMHTIKVFISMHVHHDFANYNEDLQKYFEADFKAQFTTFSYLNDNNDLVN